MTNPADHGGYFGRPAAHLRGSVIRYRGHQMTGPRPARVTLPCATVTLLLAWGHPLTIHSGRDAGHLSTHWPAMIAGLQASAMLAGFHGPGSAVEIEFTPLGARRLLGVPLHHLAKSVVDPDEILGPHWSADITDRLAGAAHWPQRWRMLDTLLTQRLCVAHPPSPVIVEIWDLVRNGGGATSLRDLMETTSLGARRIQGLLREHVGLPAQTLSRILRFHKTLAISANSRLSLGELAVMGGYHDQAHMSRDFRELSGHTPRELLGIKQRAPIQPCGDHLQPFNDFGLPPAIVERR